jgi:hypothetical protein
MRPANSAVYRYCGTSVPSAVVLADSVTTDRVSVGQFDDDAERSEQAVADRQCVSATARYRLDRSPVRGWFQVGSSAVGGREPLFTVGAEVGCARLNRRPPNQSNKDNDDEYESPYLAGGAWWCGRRISGSHRVHRCERLG